jgi:hypothetical protein
MCARRLSRREIKNKLQEIQSIVMDGNIITNDDRLKVMSNTVAIWRSLFGSTPMHVNVQISGDVPKGKIGKVIADVKKRSQSLS